MDGNLEYLSKNRSTYNSDRVKIKWYFYKYILL
jgi:hypothetical protein